jgi:hypothetical protein
MHTETVDLDLSGREAFYLCGLLQGVRLLDIDPSVSPAAQMEQDESLVRREIELSLRDKGYITLAEDGIVAVDVTAAALMSVVAFPHVTFGIVGVGTGGDANRVAYHLQDTLAVEVHRETGTSYRLTALERKDIARHIHDRWAPGDLGAPPGEHRPLPERVLQTVRWLALQMRSEHDARLALEGVGLPAAMAASIARTVARPRNSGGMIAIRPDATGGEQAGELAMLSGEDGTWLFRRLSTTQAGQVDVVPCAAPDLMLALRHFVGHYCLNGEQPSSDVPDLS